MFVYKKLCAIKINFALKHFSIFLAHHYTKNYVDFVKIILISENILLNNRFDCAKAVSDHK